MGKGLPQSKKQPLIHTTAERKTIHSRADGGGPDRALPGNPVIDSTTMKKKTGEGYKRRRWGGLGENRLPEPGSVGTSRLSHAVFWESWGRGG